MLQRVLHQPPLCAGDQTGHLLFRLQEGEVPTEHAPQVIVIMIGVNDLNSARRDGMDPFHAVPGIATRYIPALVGIFDALLFFLMPRNDCC